jgi:hypothetical protein
MPGYLLHVGAVVQCIHGGMAQPTIPNPRVQVMGQPIVTQASPYLIAGCPVPPPPAANGPCVTANWVKGAVRVKAMGVPVLLQFSEAVCVPTGTGLIVSAIQGRVKGM